MENINEQENLGTVKISDEVVNVIAEIAALEIDGVQGMQGGAAAAVGNNISQILKGKKATGKSVKVALGEGTAIIDIFLSVEYGRKIPDIVAQVQENVKKTVEAMTGLAVEAVNMNITNIYMPKAEIEQ